MTNNLEFSLESLEKQEWYNKYFVILQELKSQAAKILGSVDFLGNPLGLFNDVTEGISGLLNEGNVGGLIKNVTHGVSNSAAKVRSFYKVMVRSDSMNPKSISWRNGF